MLWRRKLRDRLRGRDIKRKAAKNMKMKKNLKEGEEKKNKNQKKEKKMQKKRMKQIEHWISGADDASLCT